MAVNWSSFVVDGENVTLPYSLAISVTILALVISTLFMLRKLRKLFLGRANDKQACSNDARTAADVGKSEACEHDSLIGGNDGDDQTILGKVSDVPTTGIHKTSAGQVLSPRYPDPVEYCEHIQGEFKRVQQSLTTRTIQKSLTDQQLEEEKEVQRQQLAEIFRLMREQEQRFGVGSMDEIQEQMKLYAL